MKTTINPKTNERANVLLVVIGVTLVAGITLASFLKLTAGQNTAVARSQAWNASIPVVEAGIEEAMTHLNDNCTYTDISHPNTNSWAIDGWTTTDVGVKKTTYLPGNSFYTVEIITVAPYSPFQPAIVSEGHMASPFANQIQSPNPIFASIDPTITPTTTTQTLNTNVARRVRVTAGQHGIFSKGLVAKYNIDLNGNNIATDSFDSTDPAYSSNGQYDPTKHKSNGDIATDSGLINSLSVGNANIAGHVSTGYGGSISIGANGTVGDLAWTSTQTGVQPGHSSDDMNVYFPDVKPPFTGGFSTPPGPLTLTNLDRTTGTTTNTVNSYPVGQNPVITNTTTVTTATFPAAGTYIGTPTMNTVLTTTTTLPSDGTYVGVIVTNTANATSGSLPSSGTYVGSTVTNTTSMTTSSYPSAGTYIGLVTTNTVLQTSSSYPSDGTYLGSVTTNTTATSSGSYPGAGSYTGTVTTNCSSTVTQSKTAPAPGTYCGTPWQTGNSSNNSSAWNYYKVAGYTFNKITGYSFNLISSYTYNQINGYSYQQISSYSYYLITGWTWAQIVSYTYYTYSTSVVTNVVTYDWVLGDGNYELSSFSGKVLVTGHATLYVTDSINFTGQDQITINPGASLKLYSAAQTATLGGLGVWNDGGNATNFYYYGLPSNQKVSISGNGQITGVIYAPEADLTLNGGGRDTTDFIGASVSGTATMNGHFNFHYDEDLAKHGPAQSFAIDSWNEIPLTQRY